MDKAGFCNNCLFRMFSEYYFGFHFRNQKQTIENVNNILKFFHDLLSHLKYSSYIEISNDPKYFLMSLKIHLKEQNSYKYSLPLQEIRNFPAS